MRNPPDRGPPERSRCRRARTNCSDWHFGRRAPARVPQGWKSVPTAWSTVGACGLSSLARSGSAPASDPRFVHSVAGRDRSTALRPFCGHDPPVFSSTVSSTDRRQRMQELLTQRRYAAALDEAAEALSSLGLAVRRDEAVAQEAVEVVQGALVAQQRYHLVWHRVWGVRLRGEMLETCARLAAALDGERAVLVW